jgi:RNA polymerase-binding transcription factor DksA
MMPTAGRLGEGLVREFRKRLALMRESAMRAAALEGTELGTLEPHQAGTPGEDAPAELAAAVLSSLEGRDRHALDEIDAAQARLEAGVFGSCEDCHGPIPLPRLRALPTTRHCVHCQVRAEARTAGA